MTQEHLQMEQAVIGAILIEKPAYDKVADRLKPKMFADNRNAVIYQAVADMVNSGQEVDILTVKSALQKSGMLDRAGGLLYLTEVTSRVASSANIATHASVIAQAWMLREIGRMNTVVNELLAKDSADPFTILDFMKEEMKAVEFDEVSDIDFSEAVTMAEDDLHKIDNNEVVLMPCPPFLEGFSFMPGEVIVIAADSGTGKTTVGMQWALELDKYGFGGFFSSLEMTPKALAMREMAMEAGVDGFRMRQGGLEKEQWDKWQRLKGVKKMRITQAWSPESVRAKARMYRKDKGIHENVPVYAVIDYVQLMQGKGTGEEKLTNISHALKQVALEENMVILELAQINREWVKSKDRKPTIHNIRGSDAIRHDADFVFLLYRPEFVGIEQFEDGNSTRETGVCIIGKSRIGFPGNKQEMICPIKNGKWTKDEPMFRHVVDMPDPNRVKPRLPFSERDASEFFETPF